MTTTPTIPPSRTAFPIVDKDVEQVGLTKLEWFTAMAMIAVESANIETASFKRRDCDWVVKRSVEMGDKMMAALGSTP